MNVALYRAGNLLCGLCGEPVPPDCASSATPDGNGLWDVVYLHHDGSADGPPTCYMRWEWGERP